MPILFSSLGTGDDAALLNAVRKLHIVMLLGGPAWVRMGPACKTQPRQPACSPCCTCVLTLLRLLHLRAHPAAPAAPACSPCCACCARCAHQVIIGSVNLVSTGVAIALVDRSGRRALFLEGGAQMFVAQVRS